MYGQRYLLIFSRIPRISARLIFARCACHCHSPRAWKDRRTPLTSLPVAWVCAYLFLRDAIAGLSASVDGPDSGGFEDASAVPSDSDGGGVEVAAGDGSEPDDFVRNQIYGSREVTCLVVVVGVVAVAVAVAVGGCVGLLPLLLLLLVVLLVVLRCRRCCCCRLF